MCLENNTTTEGRNEDEVMNNEEGEKDSLGVDARSDSLENVYVGSSTENLDSSEFDSVSTEVTKGDSTTSHKRTPNATPDTPVTPQAVPQLIISDVSDSVHSDLNNMNDLTVEEVT
ncbi:hypothetical protein Avbf_08849 [Armadillidium vulgare]|nr:hypothetical protein Avbf_08849 [Armadillidium vulgare]